MFLFGHVGITTVAARVGETAFPEISVYRKQSDLRYSISLLLDRLRGITGGLDYRMVIIGSMLPDIIDKPLYLLLGDRGFGLSGRDYMHSLLVNIILAAIGFVFLKFRKSWLLTLSLASFMHLILDSMWEKPVSLLWPLLGGLIGEEPEDLLTLFWEYLMSRPEIYIPEIIGILIMLYFAFGIIRKKGVLDFLKYGSLD